MKNLKNFGCLLIIFAAMLGSIALFPIANLVVKTNDLPTIARVVYIEMGLFCLMGGIVLALRQPDAAYGLGSGVAMAAAICAAVYLSYGLPAQAAYDLRHNTFYTHNIGIPLSLGCCWAGFLATHFLRQRRLTRRYR